MTTILFVLAAALAPSLPPSNRGLWIGDLQACRENLESVRVSHDDPGGPAVIIAFRPELRVILQRETERRVGKPLAVKLDGRVIMEPIVLEPITAGAIYLSVGDDVGAEPFRRAAESQCTLGSGIAAE